MQLDIKNWIFTDSTPLPKSILSTNLQKKLFGFNPVADLNSNQRSSICAQI